LAFSTKGFLWNIGNGSSVKFWIDNWAHTLGPLCERIDETISLDDLSRTVASYAYDGNWNWQELASLPTVVSQKLQLIPPPFDLAGNDTLTLGLTSNGQFSLKSAYDLVVSQDNVSVDSEYMF
jgi:hypothetical protein